MVNSDGAQGNRFELSRAIGHAAGVLALSGAVLAPLNIAAGGETIVSLGDVGGSLPGFRVDGIDAMDFAGFSVSGAGDVNGDSLDDLIISGRRADALSGEAYVVFGKRDQTPVDLATLGATGAGFLIDNLTAGDEAGFSVSGAGDVNDDFLDDLVIGAPKNGAGMAYVVFGKTDSAPLTLGSLGAAGFAIAGEAAGDVLGYSVSGAGDVNGDGLDDVIVGAPGATYGGDTIAGRAYVVFGKEDADDVALASLGTGGFLMGGIDANDSTGFSVSGAGDVNGDGLSDVIVGAYFADFLAGDTFVVFGKADNAPVDLAALGAGGFRIDGADNNDYSGYSVAGAGDVNGDGFADVIVGAFNGDPNALSNAGESYVVFGGAMPTDVSLAALGSAGFVINGATLQDYSGFAVAGGGDLDGDGLFDLVVGAPFADNIVGRDAGDGYLVHGRSSTSAVELGALGATGFRLQGAAAYDLAAFSVSGAGDVNGDGLADIVLGATGADPGGDARAGSAYVIFGPGPGVTPPESVVYRAFAAPGDQPWMPIGSVRDGSDTGTPASRAEIDFSFGSDGGGPSMETITLVRSNAQISNLNVQGQIADVMWRWETTRTDFGTAQLRFHFTDEEVGGPGATVLLHVAPTPAGPWTPRIAFQSRRRNEISAASGIPRYFALESRPMPNILRLQ